MTGFSGFTGWQPGGILAGKQEIAGKQEKRAL
jgi:hypothetical protein